MLSQTEVNSRAEKEEPHIINVKGQLEIPKSGTNEA